MSVFTKVRNLYKQYKSASPKQLVLAGVFTLALAGAIAGGFAARTATTAATLRDCDLNSIDRVSMNGGCGAANPAELVADARANNPGDLQTIYAAMGLPTGSYDAFANEAVSGTFFRDGHIEVNGLTVATNGMSMGRYSFGNSTALNLSSGTYYYGAPSVRWASGTNSLPVMVWFDENGEVKVIIMNPCGNPVPKFNKRSPSYSCDALNKFAVDGKKNTYQFSADASVNEFAQVVKFNYYFNDGSGYKLFDTTSNESDKTKEITFTKASTVKVEVVVKLIVNGKEKTVTSTLCQKEIGVVKEEFLHVCDALVATSTDNKTFRFTMTTSQSAGVTVKSADYILDGSVVTTGVNTKDGSGNVYRDYTFEDFNTHTVGIKLITFVVEGNDKVVVTPEGKCVVKVTRNKTPECKPNIPVGDKRCEELPHTGPAGTAGLFVGVSAAGAAAHRLFRSRFGRREQ